MPTALEASRERYAKLRAPDWVPVPLVQPMSTKLHLMVEESAEALTAYFRAGCPLKITLLDSTTHVGWIENLYAVRDPDPEGEGTRGAALLIPPAGDGVAFDLIYVQRIEQCPELQDRI